MLAAAILHAAKYSHRAGSHSQGATGSSSFASAGSDLLTDLKCFRRGYHARMIVPPALWTRGRQEQSSKQATECPISLPVYRVLALNSAPCGQVLLLPARAGEPFGRPAFKPTAAYASSSGFPERLSARIRLIIPQNVPLEHAAHRAACLRRPRTRDSCPRKGDIVAVIGGGPLGLMILHVAALAGFKTISTSHDASRSRAPTRRHVCRRSLHLRRGHRETRRSHSR